MLGDFEQLTLLHLVFKDHSIYLYEIQQKLDNMQDSKIHGLFSSSHASKRGYSAFRHLEIALYG